MERMTGIEPAPTAWEAVVLPLNYIRILFSQLVYFTTPLHFCLMFERLFLFPHVKQTPFMTAPDPDEFICVTACFQAPLFAVSITFRYLNAFCFPCTFRFNRTRFSFIVDFRFFTLPSLSVLSRFFRTLLFPVRYDLLSSSAFCRQYNLSVFERFLLSVRLLRFRLFRRLYFFRYKAFYVYMFLTDIPHHTFFLFTKQAKNFLTPCLHRHIMYAHMYITVIIF